MEMNLAASPDLAGSGQIGKNRPDISEVTSEGSKTVPSAPVVTSKVGANTNKTVVVD